MAPSRPGSVTDQRHPVKVLRFAPTRFAGGSLTASPNLLAQDALESFLAHPVHAKNFARGLDKGAIIFLGYDGPLLTLLMRLCSIPIVTMGMSYSALYYTIRKTMRYERGYVTPTFFRSLRDNWRQTLLAGAIFLGLRVLLYLDFGILRGYLEAGSGIGHFSVVILVLAIALLLYALWVFAYICRFQNTLREIFRNSALLAISHGGRTALSPSYIETL